MIKLLILVLSSNTYPSKRNEKAIKKTWAKHNFKNVQIVFYKSGSENKLYGNELIVNVGSQTKDIGVKTLKAIEWVNENLEFDFVFRTNTSSYINIENLLIYIEKIANRDGFIYDGKLMKLPANETRKEVNFISGAGILMNKNTIDLLIQEKSNFNKNEWDDVALGMILQENGVVATSGKRFDILGNIFKYEIDKDNYHFRCRIDNHYGYPRYLEKYVILHTHKIIEGKFVSQFKTVLNQYFFELNKLFYFQSPFWKIYELFVRTARLIVPKVIYNRLKIVLKSLDLAIKFRYLKK